MELASILRRYINHQVCVATIGQGKIVGYVATVHDDCVRLANTMTLSELEEGSWYSQMQFDDEEQVRGPRHSESLIHFHGILSVTCLDEGIDLTDAVEQGASPPPEADPPKSSIVINSNVASLQIQSQTSDEDVEEALESDLLRLSLGMQLVPLASDTGRGRLLETIARVRRSIAATLGFLMPKVRVKDDVSLPLDTYSITVSECEVARGEVMADRLLALDSDTADLAMIEGIDTQDPAFDNPAKWIDPSERRKAELAGCTVVEPDAVIATHLTQIVEQHAAELLTFDQVSRLVRRLRDTAPVAVDEVLPQVAPLATLHFVLRRLLEEGVTIRPLRAIMETIGQTAIASNDLEQIVARVRRRIGRTICTPLLDESRTLFALGLGDDSLELLTQGSGKQGQASSWRSRTALVESLREQWSRRSRAGSPLPVVVEDSVRANVSKLLNRGAPRIPVLGYEEVLADIPLQMIGELEASGTPVSEDALSSNTRASGSSHRSRPLLFSREPKPAPKRPR